MKPTRRTDCEPARLPMLLACLVFVVLVATHFSPEYGFARLINFGEHWEGPRMTTVRELSYPVVPDSAGYDGQFYVQLAMDPSLRNPEMEAAIDAPAYRARRILLPATAWLAGFGQSSWILQAYALLNILCWLLLAWLVRDLLPQDESAWMRFSRWFGILFSLGALESVRLALVDLPALLFLVLALRAWKRGQGARGGLWILPAVMTRETSILGMAGYAGLESWKRKTWLQAVGWGMLALLVFGAWMAYVHTRFSPYLGGDGNIGWPLAAWWEQLAYAFDQLGEGRWGTPRFYFGVIGALGLLFQLLFLLGRGDWRSPVWRVGVVFGLLLLFLGTEPWKSIWAAARIALPLTLAFNLYLPSGRWFYPLWWMGNAVFLLGFVRFIWI